MYSTHSKVTALKHQSEILWPVLELCPFKQTKPLGQTYFHTAWLWMDAFLHHLSTSTFPPRLVARGPADNTICLLLFIKMPHFVVIIGSLHFPTLKNGTFAHTVCSMLTLLKLGIQYMWTQESSECFRAACSLGGTSVRCVICVVAKFTPTHTWGPRKCVCSAVTLPNGWTRCVTVPCQGLSAPPSS